MPSATMEHEDPWKLPDDDFLPATLSAVTEKSFTISKGDRKGEEFTKWEWEFSITEGQYAGLRAWGDTEGKMTSHPANKVRPWAEALRGDVPFAIGEGINTDDLIGLPCFIQVSHVMYTKADGTDGYKEPVVSVISVGQVQSIDPPF